jgi:membrane fusion protein (multidrug efflux system)
MSSGDHLGMDQPVQHEAADHAAPAPERGFSPRMRLIALLILVAVVVAGGYAAIRYVTVGRYIESTNDAFFKADMVDIAPKLSGYVEQVMVADNQLVRAGTPLVRLSVGDVTARADQFSAELVAARATVAESDARLAEQGAMIASADAGLADATARLAYTRGEVARYGPLVRSGAASGEELAKRRQEFDAARADAIRAKAQLDLATRQRDTLRASTSGARAKTLAIAAQLDNARTDVGHAILTSSIDGRIGDRTVRVGQYVRPGERLMAVVPVQQIYVVANFKETQVQAMRIGQPVVIRVDALDGGAIHGVVDSFSPGTGAEFAIIPPQNATGNFTKIVQRVPVRIRLTERLPADRVIVPGMSVTVDVDTRSHRD